MHKEKVTCLDCGESDILIINDDTHQVLDYERKMETNFLAFRFRGDLNWGFRCKCGNDNRLAKSEKKDFNKLVAGDSVSIKEIAESLKIPDKLQFKVEAI